MKILLTGANGFIGRYLLASLIDAGHEVIPAVRRPWEVDRLLPAPASIAVNFNKDTQVDDWLPRLVGMDAVINCTGILQGRPGQSIDAIHTRAPKALFAACSDSGVKRVIQISAISAEPAADTAYALTKRAADDFLASTDLDWVIVRPSLVFAAGAFGGIALLRGLAALPFITPVVGKGDQIFQPIHIDDLSTAVLRLLEQPTIRHVVIDPVGPDRVTMRQILVDLRRWLGFPAAPVVEVPIKMVKLATTVGDWIGSTINSTALKQLSFGNVGSLDAFAQKIGFQPQPWRAALLAHPAQTQDRWHARLYFVRPLLRWALAIMWLLSGLIGLLQPNSLTAPLLSALGFTNAGATAAMITTCLLDLAIGVAILTRWRPGILGAMQATTIVAYTICLSIAAPALWTDPFGPLLKNLPILVAVLVLAAIENDR
jgi:uncharacterized protein YbjT (DUF2867 family)